MKTSKRLRNIFMLLGGILFFISCNQNIGRVVHLSDGSGIIENVLIKQAVTFQVTQCPDAQIGYLVSYRIKKSDDQNTIVKIKIEDHSHTTLYWHPENPSHKRGHVFPKTNQELTTYKGRLYVKVEFVYLDAENNLVESTREDTWIPFDKYKDPSFDATKDLYVGMLMGINGNYIKINGNRLVRETSRTHPPHD